MSWEDYINGDVVFDETLFLRVSPRRKVSHTSFSVYSGSVYSCPFTLGVISDLQIDDVSLTQGTSTSLSAGEWYYSNDVLYVRKSDSTAPDSADFIVAVYELYFSSIDAQWYRIPTDSASTPAAWSPYITKFPDIKQTTSDLLSGYIPTTISGFTVDNSEHWAEIHLHDSSFYKAEVKGWHGAGTDLITTNIKLVFDGLIDSVAYAQNSIEFSVADLNDAFDNEYRSGVASSDFYDLAEFSGLDPQFIGKPKRRIYGYVKGLKCVNLNFDSTTNTESTNNLWATGLAPFAQGTISFKSEISSTSGNDIFFTNSDFVVNFEVGDYIQQGTGFIVTSTPIITAIGSNYITVSVAPPASPGLSDRVFIRGRVPRARIEKDETVYIARQFQHYTVAFSNNVSYLSFTAGYVASLSMSAAINHNDPVFCDLFGSIVTNYVSAQNNDSDYTACTMNGIDILYDILVSSMEIPTGSIASTFATLSSTVVDRVSFTIPKNVGDEYPHYKDVVQELLFTLRLRLFKDSDNKWSIKRIEAIPSTVESIVDDQILSSSFKVDYKFSDIVSDIFIDYNRKERGLLIGQTEEYYDTVTTESLTAKYLHKRKQQKTFQSLHLESADAQDLSDFISYVYGDRQARYTVSLHKEFYDSLIADNVEISREKLPGFSYVEDTLRARNLVVTEINKNPKQVTLTLDDQKGLEDNT